MKHPMEILAPAGAFDSVKAAVQCGADAVYLGSKVLNARRNADNFGIQELEETVKYCHIRGVKVYLTLNTLLFDPETEEALQLMEEACRADIDAAIVQDLGVVSYLREICPELPLHGSTQMAVHNLEGVRELEALGFSRVVLARELSRAEISHICRNTSLETEIFVHGALCMSISGQCYLSSMIGERSGNRGLCAQPCRLPFQASGGVTHGLSLKDLTLIGHLEELGELGISSLKIEGRMKRPEYVAAAVTACQQALAGEKPDLDKLRAVFSRSGFTDGYFTGDLGPQMFGTRQKEDVLSAQTVLKEYAGLFQKETPQVGVSFSFSLKEGKPAALSCRDEEGNTASATGEIPQQALHKPTDTALVKKSLQKTGETAYYPLSVQTEIDPGLVLPVSQINALRREVLQNLDSLRQNYHHYRVTPIAPPAFPKFCNLKYPTLRGRFSRAQGITPPVLEALELCILPPEELLQFLRHRPLDFLDMEKLAVEIPRIHFSSADNQEARHLREQLKEIHRQGIGKAIVGNIGSLSLAEEAQLQPLGDFSLNITNSKALEAYARRGLKDATVSFELSLARAKALADFLPFGILAYGYLPLMIMRNCPIQNAMGCQACGKGFQTLTDRKGAKFFVDCQNGQAQLFNSVPLYLADRLSEMEGFSFLTLYFTKESPEQIQEILTAYQKGSPKEAVSFLQEGITRGLYYRTVR